MNLSSRHVFIDQARGYAIFGMILVNFLGNFDAMPWTLKHHHEGFSYADHIAPLFIFIVGIGFCMSFQKRTAKEGITRARWHALRRYAIICVLGLIYGGFNLRVAVWDALLDIGLSGLLALPFLHCKPLARIGVACIYLGIYQSFYSLTGYGEWVMRHSINGGPLGPLSWVFILLWGTVGWDMIDKQPRAKILTTFLIAAAALSAVGWLLRAEWPGLKDFWPFSQFGMSAPYPVYATGLCFASVAFFLLLNREGRFEVRPLTTLGKNPLVIYLLQAVLVGIADVYINPALSIPTALLLFGGVLGICYGVAWYLESTGRIIKIG